MLCFFGVGLVACDGRTPEEKAFTYPTETDTVSSNGGLAVRKGNYIYFVNGYMSVDDEAHEQGKGTTHGALMLMKLDENGQVVRDDNGLLKDEYYITMSNKLAGFEATGVFVAGDYLYFTSPSQENKGGDDASNGKETWAKELVEFYKMKLDKSSSPERIYQSINANSSVEFKYYEKDGSAYILVYEKGSTAEDKKLIRIKASNNSSEEIETEINSVVMADDGESIVFTKAGDNGTEIYRYNIFANSTDHIDTLDSDTFKEIKMVSEDYVYYTDADDRLQRTSLDNSNSIGWTAEYVGHYDKLVVIPHGDKVIAIKGNSIKFLNSNGERYEDVDTDKINFIGFNNGNIVYYDDNNNIKTLNYNHTNATIKTIESGIMTGDLAALSTLENKKTVTTEEFLIAVNEELKKVI